jgi:hypothetical protein
MAATASAGPMPVTARTCWRLAETGSQVRGPNAIDVIARPAARDGLRLARRLVGGTVLLMCQVTRTGQPLAGG